MPLAIDIEAVFDRFIGKGDALERLQAVLARMAPEWWSGAHLYLGPRRRDSIEVQQPDGLRRAALVEAFARGPVYQAMVATHGAGDERRFGMVEIRGTTPALTVILNLDERPLARMQDDSLLLGNRVTLQVRRQRVDGTPIRQWAEDALRSVAHELGPAWGRASATDEYTAKVMGEFPNGAQGAVGRDFARFLPGLFWLNVFGDPYVDLIGRRRLATTPAADVAEVGPAISVKLGGDPEAWNGEAYERTEMTVREHLGRDLFYEASAPSRSTRAPKWGPPVLARPTG